MQRIIPGGRSDTPGTRRADIHAFGADCSTRNLDRFGFDTTVSPGGYRWLYADAISQDGRFGLVLIALIGSVFSPYYAWAGRRAPHNHCALNVCLYGPRVSRWTMTERRENTVRASASELVIGPSAVRCDNDTLVYDIAEYGAPLPFAVRGRVTITPETIQPETFTLDSGGQHVWRPFWPKARVTARFEKPDLHFSGEGYVDMNAGTAPLEAGFRSWSWARTPLEQSTAIVYDSEWRGGGSSHLAIEIGRDGHARHFEPPGEMHLPRTLWQVERPARSDGVARVMKTLEDTPFYSRSLIETDILGQPRLSMHESLDLDRFASPVVKAMLPFRMPRAFWR